MEMVITAVLFTLMACGLLYAGNQWHLWRKRALQLQAFVENPNVQARDKEAEYKDSYEAMKNALDEERRQQHVAMNEVFDVLNEEAHESDNPRLMQCRNVLLKALQISTYGR